MKIKPIKRLVRVPFQRLYWIHILVTIFGAVCYTYFQKLDLERQVNQLVTTRTRSVQEAISKLPDAIPIQREASLILEVLHQRVGDGAQIEILLNDKRVTLLGFETTQKISSQVIRQLPTEPGKTITLVLTLNWIRILKEGARFLLILGVMGAIGVLLIRPLVKPTLIGVLRDIQDLEEWTGTFHQATLARPKLRSQELQELADKVQTQIEVLHLSPDDQVTNLSKKFQEKMAAQVSHDLRSPLSGLIQLGTEESGLPESVRLRIKSATSRIQDIANRLSDTGRVYQKPSSQDSVDTYSGMDEGDPELVSSMIVRSISKVMRPYSDKERPMIEFDPQTGFGIFSQVGTVEFENNLVQHITKALTAVKPHAELTISISQQGPVPMVAMAEKTTNKILFQMNLDLASPPTWFPQTIEIPENGVVVVVDDDDSVHKMWAARLDVFQKANQNRFSVKYFYKESEFVNWYRMLDYDLRTVQFLFDQELTGSEKTGLEIIRWGSLEAQSILVTSRFDDVGVRETCAKRGIRILSKDLAPYIPLVRVPGISEVS